MRPLVGIYLGTSAGKPDGGINGSILKAAPVPVPPIAEQLRIVAEAERRLSVVEELETTVKANIQRSARLRQAILQSAFAG
jgi:type I restriction enzyme, S subunit